MSYSVDSVYQSNYKGHRLSADMEMRNHDVRVVINNELVEDVS